jgi:hypothetical protein
MACAATKTVQEVSFDCPEAERKIIRQIARRAPDLYLEQRVDRPVIDIDMDLVATHCNGNPLRLNDLLAADDFNLLHDVSKIARHLNRETGKLEDHFRPRFSRPADMRDSPLRSRS